MSADLSPSTVELAHEPAFRLGRLEVTPSLGEVAWNGERQTLQPRVMQVLVALARHPGQVVSRDQLVELCWDARAVGDDAIHRCTAVLRRLGEQSGAFTLDTLPRIGHRLRVAEEASAPRSIRAFRVPLAIFVAILLLAAGLVGWWTLRPSGPASTATVEVASFEYIGAGEQGRERAASLGADIAGMLNETGVQTTSTARTPLGRQAGDLRLRGALTPVGEQLRVRVFLDDPSHDLILWSADFEGSASEIERLRDEVAAATIETIATALEPRAQRGLRLDPETLAIHIRGSDVVRSPQLLREGEPRRAFEQVVRRAPDFAMGHGVLAVALSNEAGRAPAGAREELRRRSEAAARKAISIDPANAGAAYDALYRLQRQRAPRDLAAGERVLLEGLEAAPDFHFLHMRRCRFLLEVGRAAEALPSCQRALALRPMAGPIGYTHARALQSNGDFALAEQAIERAIRYNPDHGMTRQIRFELAAFEGSAAKAASGPPPPAPASSHIGTRPADGPTSVACRSRGPTARASPRSPCARRPGYCSTRPPRGPPSQTPGSSAPTPASRMTLSAHTAALHARVAAAAARPVAASARQQAAAARRPRTASTPSTTCWRRTPASRRTRKRPAPPPSPARLRPA